ncbi:MAG: tryptophan--tRNA ligase [Chloroflexi bacterium]|nr:MAG: tryptophan--tRNA ligase [Chloroflexota bacterium]
MSSPGPQPGRRLRILSGMQPTGRLHIGNYLGALRNWVRLQDDYDCFYCIVDYHALTTVTDPAALRPAVEDCALDWLAARLDPERSVIFLQSDVPEVAELHLLLSMTTPLSWLERVPSFKEKADEHPDNVNYGLLGYPVLQAADILLYAGERVPVGEDQLPHLELTREIARRFNHRYRPVLVEPQPIISDTPRVMGTDGVSKMSKSRGNAILMSAEPDELLRVVSTMVTDVLRPRRSDPGHPESCNVCQLHRIFSPDRYSEIWEGERTARTGCVDTKKALAVAVAEYFAPVRERRHELEARPGAVWEILAEGAARARVTARETIAAVRDAMGLGAAG